MRDGKPMENFEGFSSRERMQAKIAEWKIESSQSKKKSLFIKRKKKLKYFSFLAQYQIN